MFPDWEAAIHPLLVSHWGTKGFIGKAGVSALPGIHVNSRPIEMGLGSFAPLGSQGPLALLAPVP